MAYSGAYRMRETAEPPEHTEPARPARENQPPRRQQDVLSGAVGAIVKRIESANLETDDLIMALILYLMYRESGDKDLLIMLGAMFLL